MQHIIILHGNVIVSVLESDYLTCLMDLRSGRSRVMLSTLQFVGHKSQTMVMQKTTPMKNGSACEMNLINKRKYHMNNLDVFR